MKKLTLVISKFLALNLLLTTTLFANTVEITQDYKPKLVNGTGDLIIPLPLDGKGYQKVLEQNISGNATVVKTKFVKLDSNKENNVEFLHAHWENVENANIKVVQKVELTNRETPTSETSSVSYFLKPTKHVQTDGIVLETAKKITKGLKTSDEKAEAIYNWIVDNTFRDPNVRGCGLGDVKSLLQSGNFSGKCADLNSLFVGLVKASGIPAREVWGLRVAPSKWQSVLGKEGDVSKSQHCRAEYYSDIKKAWIPADPADIRKLILDGKLAADHPDVKRMRKALFGTWEGNWIAYNHGRDFQIPELKENINYLMYPQLVTAKFSPDGIDPTEVSYSITSRLIK